MLDSDFLIPGGVFLFVLPFGFWLARLGRPYNGLIFNAHKLIALGAVVITVMRLTDTLKTTETGALDKVFLVVAALCVVALFASGAMMSANKLDYARMRLLHRIAPPLLAGTMILAVYLLG